MSELANILLAILFFSILSIILFDVAKKIKIPYTVMLVLTGSLLYYLIPVFSLDFLLSFSLSPDLLFYVFLPLLLFESAYHMKVEEVKSNIFSISTLAILGLFLSIFITSIGLYFFLPFFGIEIPFIVLLLFGAIISSTDPVAVLSLFKEYGVPRRLALLFEGESVFNDGSAYSVFLIILGLMIAMSSGIDSSFNIMHGVMMFVVMVLGGIAFGLISGKFFKTMLEAYKDKDLSITIMLASAHITFILAEILSKNVKIFDFDMHISPIIATVVCAIYLGDYIRKDYDVSSQKMFAGFWGYFAFLSNSLVFILMGLLFMEVKVPLEGLLIPIILSIVVVMAARAISIYATINPLNYLVKKEAIPMNWQHLLAWGSLRGALAIIMAIMIPDDLTHPDWNFNFSIKDFLLALTIGCIYFTLLIKALTIPGVIKRLGIGK